MRLAVLISSRNPTTTGWLRSRVKEANILQLVFFEDLKILLLEVGNKAALFIRHGHRDDHFVHRDANGILAFGRGTRLRRRRRR